jgi:hypothetical protein
VTLMGCWYCRIPVPPKEVVCPHCGALNNGTNPPESSPSNCTDDPPNGNPEPAVETAPNCIVLPLPADPAEVALTLENRFGEAWMWELVDSWQLHLQKKPKSRRRGRPGREYRAGVSLSGSPAL